jgi:hypothetical protein
MSTEEEDAKGVRRFLGQEGAVGSPCRSGFSGKRCPEIELARSTPAPSFRTVKPPGSQKSASEADIDVRIQIREFDAPAVRQSAV